jgi:DNA-binding response OmpR family regulator
MAKKVLVVDDDVNTVKFLTAALEQNGYEAIGAYNGQEGLGMLKSEKPDALILDVMMPKKTGVAEVLTDLDDQSEDTHERPYDALREKMRQAIKEMKEEGLVKPDVFIDKPIDPELVISKIKELIGD